MRSGQPTARDATERWLVGQDPHPDSGDTGDTGDRSPFPRSRFDLLDGVVVDDSDTVSDADFQQLFGGDQPTVPLRDDPTNTNE